jgi:hypothetical protein
MSGVVAARDLAGSGGGWRVGRRWHRNTTNGRQDKSPDLRPAHVVGLIEVFQSLRYWRRWRFCRYLNQINADSASRFVKSAGKCNDHAG